MQIHAGTLSKETQESNSLVMNMLKYPTIASKMLQLFPQYSLQYFVDGTNKFAKEETVGSNKYEWFLRGRLSRPVTCTGVASGTGANNSDFTFEANENYLNPNDTIKIGSRQAVVQAEPIASAGGYTYTAKLKDNLAVVDPSATGDFAAGKTIGKIATNFSEGSERGYETHVYPDKYVNYLNTYRKASSITGDAATDVVWIESGGQKVWMHQDAMDQMMQFMYEREVDSWYGETTVNADGSYRMYDNKTGKPIIAGDGILKQIDGSNIDSYNGELTEKQITQFIAHMRMNTGYINNNYMVYTGTGGFEAFDRAMKDYFVAAGGNTAISTSTDQSEVALGFKSYQTLGTKITLVHNPIFDDDTLHTDIDPLTGFPKESFRMVFLNWGSHAGVNNIERKVKGAGKIKRSMVIKHIAGMTDLDNPSKLYAANSRDAFTCEFLDHSGIVVRNPFSCGEFVKI